MKKLNTIILILLGMICTQLYAVQLNSIYPLKPNDSEAFYFTPENYPIKADGKMDLSVREKAYLQMDEDARKIFERMEASGGSLPFTDKADPERIRQEFDMSKNAFKRAVGRLLKAGKIKITEKNIEILNR